MPLDRPRLSRALTLGVALVIVALTLVPAQVTPLREIAHIDKLWHALAFATLILPAALLDPRAVRLILPMGLALGLGIELIQPLVGREASALDVAADLGGLVLGLVLGRAARRHLGTP